MSKALGLYRRAMKMARTWPKRVGDSMKEPSFETIRTQNYIREETRKLFRDPATRDERDPAIIKELIQKGNDRIEMILHYGIAAPKLHHVAEVEATVESADDGLDEGIAEAMDTSVETEMDFGHLKRKDLQG